jgi:hypothetical protein
MRDDPRLYDIAKRITLDAGFDYTDPRTGETTRARRRRGKRAKRPRLRGGKLKKALR